MLSEHSTSVDGYTIDTRHPREALMVWLELHCKMLGNVPPQGFHYPHMYAFLLKHGRFYDPATQAADWKGAPKACYGNAIVYGARKGLRYVEGIAAPTYPASHDIFFPVDHAWNTDESGRLYEVTWRPVGRAYFGVEFSVERADDATWNGDSCVLNDYMRRHPLYRKPWKGERWNRRWPRSPRLLAARLGELHTFSEAHEIALQIKTMLAAVTSENENPDARITFDLADAAEDDLAAIRSYLTDTENQHVVLRVK